MVKPITFCIATAKNEKQYLKLLLESLQKNTEINNHEVLVFIDTDNQNTYEYLLNKKKEMPNLKIHKNKLEFQIGGQRNVSVMFNYAKNELVCNLHSDMVVGVDFDKHISEAMNEKNIFLSCTRIEPPLHPPDHQKIVVDFGLTPETFNFDEFNLFVKKLQNENRRSINEYSTPFVIYKDVYFNLIGGFDTQFRCSSEDHDMIIRLEQNGIKCIQIWNACVYHFTCISSRGNDWYKKEDREIMYTNTLQQYADIEEKKRFIRKWGFFGRSKRSVYDVGLFIDMDMAVDFTILETVEPYFTQIYLNDNAVKKFLLETIKFKSDYYANLRWGYSHDFWKSRKYLFESVNQENRILFMEDTNKIKNDCLMEIKFSDLLNSLSTNIYPEIKYVMQNPHLIVDSYETGIYELMSLKIKIRNKNDVSEKMKRFNMIDDILKDDNFEFI